MLQSPYTLVPRPRRAEGYRDGIDYIYKRYCTLVQVCHLIAPSSFWEPLKIQICYAERLHTPLHPDHLLHQKRVAML